MKKEDFVNNAYEGYLEMYDGEDKVVIDLNGFDYCDECKNENGELNLELIAELNEMLINKFSENGFEIYREGGFYPENGQFENVNPDTVVAISNHLQENDFENEEVR